MDTKVGILIIASGEERVKMNVYEWLESPGVREQAKAGRDPSLFADSKQGRGRLKNCGGGNKEWGKNPAQRRTPGTVEKPVPPW